MLHLHAMLLYALMHLHLYALMHLHLYALAFRALLFLVLIDVGGYIRSPIPAAQDLRVLVDSHLMLSKHVKVIIVIIMYRV